ncbi:hypothetical protein PV325_002496 [Microctonus aethiopoides]|nr:hypothetical protein PV325_002496 [Microctonus aethiopoides]
MEVNKDEDLIGGTNEEENEKPYEKCNERDNESVTCNSTEVASDEEGVMAEEKSEAGGDRGSCSRAERIVAKGGVAEEEDDSVKCCKNRVKGEGNSAMSGRDKKGLEGGIRENSIVQCEDGKIGKDDNDAGQRGKNGDETEMESATQRYHIYNLEKRLLEEQEKNMTRHEEKEGSPKNILHELHEIHGKSSRVEVQEGGVITDENLSTNKNGKGRRRGIRRVSGDREGGAGRNDTGTGRRERGMQKEKEGSKERESIRKKAPYAPLKNILGSGGVRRQKRRGRCLKKEGEICNDWEIKRWEEINEAKNTGEWWRGIRRFRVRKRGKADANIGKEKWREHFSSLLNRQGQGQEQNKGSKGCGEGSWANEEVGHIDNKELDASFREKK